MNNWSHQNEGIKIRSQIYGTAVRIMAGTKHDNSLINIRQAARVAVTTIFFNP